MILDTLLDTHPEKVEKIHASPSSHAAPFRIIKTWKHPKCPPTDEWIKKVWYLCTMGHYSALKRNKRTSLQQHRWA